MISNKLVRYISGAMTHKKQIQKEQLAEIIGTVNRLHQTANSLSGDPEAFHKVKVAVLDFIDAQDGVGYDEDGGGTGLLGDTEILEVAGRYLLRREKDVETARFLVEVMYRQAQGTPLPSTVKMVNIGDITR